LFLFLSILVIAYVIIRMILKWKKYFQPQ
jgi:hypothetical protein